MGEVVTAVGSVRPATSADLWAVQALLRAADLPVDGVEDQFEDGYVVHEADGLGKRGCRIS